jgi:hypothetical protein
MGRRAWLERAIGEEYLPAIAGLEDSLEGRESARELTVTIRSGWEGRGFTALNQQQSLMDRTRRALRERFGDGHFSLEIVDFTRDEYFQLNRQKQSRARDRQLHQIYLKDPDAIVATASALLDSPEWAEVAAGLAVLTGRRLNEVLRTAEFTVKSERVVTFKGALKRGGEPVPLVFDIPTLTGAERIVMATERLRVITPPDANETKVAAASDRHFAPLVPVPYGKDHLYSHLWRSVFCCIATFWYCPKHVDDLLFKAHIMGHFETLTAREVGDGQLLRERLESFNSERHYRLYEIDDETIARHGGRRKGIMLGTDGIEPLEVFQRGLPENQPVRPPRKTRSSLRVWKDDHDAIASFLNRFEGKTQADRVSSWLKWSLESLDRKVSSEPDDATETTPSTLAPVEDTIDTPTDDTPATALERTEVIAGATIATDTLIEGETDEKVLDAPPAGETPAEHLPETSAAPLPETSNETGSGEVKGTDGETATGNAIETIRSVPPPAPTTGLEAKIDRLIDVMTVFVEAQTGKAPTETTETTAPVKTPARDRPQSVAGKNGETGTAPRKYKTGEADTTINRAIDAIIAHNDLDGRLHDDKWAITINALKNYSLNQRAIERIVAGRKDEIDTHHQKHQLGNRHNDRHKRKHKISDIIQI